LAAHSTDSRGLSHARFLTFDYVRSGGRRSRFEGILLHADRELIVLSHEARPSKALYFGGEEVIARGYAVVWFLYKGQPFDIGRFYRPDGSWTGYYVDILEPVQWDEDNPDSIAPLVDLELDLWIAPDASYGVLDEDEFEASVLGGSLSEAQAMQARATLTQIVSSIDDDNFPPRLVKDFLRDSQDNAAAFLHGSKEPHNIDPKRDC
jgi:predicted RNA-binding protein associated with RNAse of E/G family